METATVYRLADLALVTLTSVVVLAIPGVADEPAKSVVEKPTYLLRYQLKPGERLDYEVTHVAKTQTRIRGTEETSRVHTVSQRHWQVTSVGEEGEMVFDHVLDSVSLTQQQGDSEEIRWDSTSGERPPNMFKVVADQIGSRLATLTINSRGQELDRDQAGGTESTLGMGSLTLAFPDEAIPVGHSWSVPHEVKARGENGEVKPIKIRQLYTLEKVETGVATLSVRSNPITPVREESIRAQLVQQLSNGTIRFDIDSGRMLSKQLDWDERVVGFQGENSLMEYHARFTERLVDGPSKVARRPE